MKGIEVSFLTSDALWLEKWPEKISGWSGAEILKSLMNPRVFGFYAVVAQEKVGIIVGRLIAEEAEILTFGVLSHAQKRGVGRSLLDQFIAEVREKKGKFIFLEVAVNNLKAITLYESLGFVESSMRDSYYCVEGQRIDAWLFKMDL